MMVFLLQLAALVSCCIAVQASVSGRSLVPRQAVSNITHNPQQSIVEWDAQSLYINGQRLMIMSGEFHPFRLPVPGLWLDIFQKLKALNFNAVSFYAAWALLEGKQGDFSAEGIFDFQPFFDAASEAGIYLIARPGPYINAEITGGGFPGWLQRIKGHLRTADPDYLSASGAYVQDISSIISKAQITNGGPVILLQPENEYTQAVPGVVFPDPVYFQDVIDQYLNGGITVPLVSNDALPDGHNAPNPPGAGTVDIYGHDGYPLGFDCSHPTVWPPPSNQFPVGIPLNWSTVHYEESPLTPYDIAEFQAGSFDGWAGAGYDMCNALLNEEFERVLNKNNYGFGVKIFSLYIMFGGTNWGNLAFPGVYTSYDYGAAIDESRGVTREKYSELKLQASFLKVSPAYLTSRPQNLTNGTYTNTGDISTTRLQNNPTSFWIVRHANYSSLESTPYKLILPTSAGTITIPQLNGTLSLNGRDSKIHVTDYDVGGINLLYSSAEIFTWQQYDSKKVLILYGGPGEGHEAAFNTTSKVTTGRNNGVTVKAINGTTIINWTTTSKQRMLQFDCDLTVILLDRNSAYNYWVLEVPAAKSTGNFSSPTSVIVQAGYLLRTASITDDTLSLTGDLNATTPIVVVGAPSTVEKVAFNGADVHTKTRNGVISGQVQYKKPTIQLPSMDSLRWNMIDSLPEIKPTYDDSLWTTANITSTHLNNGILSTPTSLFSTDYGYNTGTQLFRGHFVAAGNETKFTIQTIGGAGFGSSVWLNGTFLGSWVGSNNNANYNQTLKLPTLQAGQPAIFTVVIDHMGLEEDGRVGQDESKTPRGILNYTLTGHPQSDISWKLTGNLGGEDYIDRTRGPLNEGGLYAERQGFYLPDPPTSSFPSGTPVEAISTAGIQFFTTSFNLDLPSGYDIPLSFQFTNTSLNATTPANIRCQLYVNGYQFGKYINNLGPQTSFPVPEGILNYQSKNYIALSVWALDAGGAKLAGFNLTAGHPIQTSYGPVAASPQPPWRNRTGAY